MTWRTIWLGLSTAAVVPLPIFYGPKKIMETWRWYMHEFVDKPVFRELCKRRHGHFYGNGFNVADLVQSTGRKEKSIIKSLARLEDRNSAVMTGNGWFGVKP